MLKNQHLVLVILFLLLAQNLLGLLVSLEKLFGIQKNGNQFSMSLQFTDLEEDPVNLSPNSGVGMIQAYEAARRAVLRCQPYKLPADKYETWREMEIELDPSEMVLR